MTESLSEKFFVGLDITGFEDTGKYRPISRVTLMVDDSNAITAGDDSGLEITATCPHATQEMVNALLSQLQGYQYQSFTADAANLDPSAELGDGVTVSGVYSTLSRLDDDGEGFPDISAPGEVALEEEYPAAGPMTQEFNRKIAQTRSLISKTSEEILLQVYDLGDQVSSISTKLDSITLTVQNGSTSSTIKLMAGSAEISSQTIQMNGLVTFTGLQNGTTTIDGACIKTGTIDADRLNLTGSITFGDLSSSVQNDINDAYSMAWQAQSDASSAQSTVESWSYGGTTYIDGTQIMTGTVRASTLEGGYIALLSSSERTVGELTMTGASTATYAVDLYSYGALRLTAGSGAVFIEGGSSFIELDSRISCGNDIAPSVSGGYSCGISTRRWSDIYADNSEIQTSDQNKKHDIEELPEKYLEMMDRIRPVRYRLNDGTSGRFHVGFIAQEVEQAMADAKIGSLEFGGWVKDIDEDGNDIYMLRYSEFIAVLWAKIRQLESRLEATA